MFSEDGKLSWDEWMTEQNKIKEELQKMKLALIKETFKYVDRNNDNSLNLKEFKKYLENESLEKKNAKTYLESLGGKMTFDQFVEFEGSTPNATFPYQYDYYNYYDYSYDDDYDNNKKENNKSKSKSKNNNNKKNKKNKNKNKKNQSASVTPVTEIPVDDTRINRTALEPEAEQNRTEGILIEESPVQKLVTLDTLLRDSGITKPAVDNSGNSKLNVETNTTQKPLVQIAEVVRNFSTSASP